RARSGFGSGRSVRRWRRAGTPPRFSGDDRGAGLLASFTSDNGLLPASAHDSRLSIDLSGRRTTPGRRAALGGGKNVSPGRDWPHDGIDGARVGRGEIRRGGSL